MPFLSLTEQNGWGRQIRVNKAKPKEDNRPSREFVRKPDFQEQ